MQIVDYNKQKLLKSNLAKKLYKKLIAIENDDDWALAIIDELYADDKKYKKMIEIIDNGEADFNNLFEIADELGNN